MVLKPSGTLRFPNDFRELKVVLKFGAYAMSQVDKLIERLGLAWYITTIDLTKGYSQILLIKEARKKTVFST